MVNGLAVIFLTLTIGQAQAVPRPCDQAALDHVKSGTKGYVIYFGTQFELLNDLRSEYLTTIEQEYLGKLDDPKQGLLRVGQGQGMLKAIQKIDARLASIKPCTDLIK